MSTSSKKTVLVTGANGFVAGHIIRAFLTAGYNVRGTIRSEKSIARLQSTHSQYSNQLSFAVVPDITKPELYENALVDVDGIIHTAFPFSLHAEDMRKDLLDPAIDGSLGVLEAAQRYGKNVKKVVTLCSFADNLDLSLGYRPGYTYTDADWNPVTYEQAAASKDAAFAYCASKALAEKAAFEWMDKHGPNFTFTALCPPWIFGPHVDRIDDLKKLNESASALYGLLGAKEVPPIDFAGFIDVRDVAEAHVLAFENDGADGQRFIIGQRFNYQSAVDAIREALPEIKDRVPEGHPGTGPEVLKDVYNLDSSNAQRVLGLKYTPLKVTMKDTVEQLLEAERQM